MPLTASMDATEPPEDTAAEGAAVLCPDGGWYVVVSGPGEYVHEADGQDFEVAWADPQWVAGVEGTFCFSWVEFHAWALRTGYDYRFASVESGYFGEAVFTADASGIVACDG